eukprot:365433-Chlamydomonas_euryale.AAC.10
MNERLVRQGKQTWWRRMEADVEAHGSRHGGDAWRRKRPAGVCGRQEDGCALAAAAAKVL